MVLVLLAWAAYLYLADRCVFHHLSLGGFLPTMIILIILFVALVVFSVKHLTKPSKKQREAAQKFYNAVVNKNTQDS